MKNIDNMNDNELQFLFDKYFCWYYVYKLENWNTVIPALLYYATNIYLTQ
jgi:hypothetical protein